MQDFGGALKHASSSGGNQSRNAPGLGFSLLLIVSNIVCHKVCPRLISAAGVANPWPGHVAYIWVGMVNDTAPTLLVARTVARTVALIASRTVALAVAVTAQPPCTECSSGAMEQQFSCSQ